MQAGLQSDPAEATMDREEEPRETYVWQTTQKWTLLHSYYAHMGGIICPKSSSTRSYSIITATQLTSQYHWFGEDYPLKHLILQEKDIQNASKANWLLKTIAIL